MNTERKIEVTASGKLTLKELKPGLADAAKFEMELVVTNKELSDLCFGKKAALTETGVDLFMKAFAGALYGIILAPPENMKVTEDLLFGMLRENISMLKQINISPVSIVTKVGSNDPRPASSEN